MKLIEAIEKLNQILEAKEPFKKELVKFFQNEIWNDENMDSTDLSELLSELAYDLDFYEPNEKWRKEHTSYYDEIHLTQLINTALNNIRAIHQ